MTTTVLDRKKKQYTEPLILTNYETWDELEDDNCTKWQTLTDQYGEVHTLDLSPY